MLTVLRRDVWRKWEKQTELNKHIKRRWRMISARGASFFVGGEFGRKPCSATPKSNVPRGERNFLLFSLFDIVLLERWREREAIEFRGWFVCWQHGRLLYSYIWAPGARRARVLWQDPKSAYSYDGRVGVIARRAASFLSRRLLQRNKQIRKMERGCNIQRERVQINPSITLLQLPRQQRNWEAQQQIDAAVNIKKRRINQSSASLCRRL